jgi:hypothetical protein
MARSRPFPTGPWGADPAAVDPGARWTRAPTSRLPAGAPTRRAEAARRAPGVRSASPVGPSVGLGGENTLTGSADCETFGRRPGRHARRPPARAPPPRAAACHMAVWRSFASSATRRGRPRAQTHAECPPNGPYRVIRAKFGSGHRCPDLAPSASARQAAGCQGVVRRTQPDSVAGENGRPLVRAACRSQPNGVSDRRSEPGRRHPMGG